MNSRLEMVVQSLKEGSLDRTLYEIISEMTAEEWVSSINNPEYLSLLQPYLIYTYDAEKIEEICEKGDTQVVARTLTDAWFAVYCGGSNEESEQPPLLDLAGTPALLPLFSGHLINIVSKANYSHDTAPFIRDKFKHLSNEMLNYTKSQNYNERFLITGCHEKHPMFPVYHDYDENKVNDAFTLLYLVSSISKLTGMLDFEHMTPERQSMLDNGNILSLIETSKVGETKKRRNLKQYESVEQFITDNYSAYCHLFSEFFFDSKEIAYQRTLYSRGLVQPPVQPATEEVVKVEVDEGNLELPSIEIDQDHLNTKGDKGLFSKVMDSIKNALSDDDSDEENEKPQVADTKTIAKKKKAEKPKPVIKEEENDINELIYPSKKKKGNGMVLAAVVLIGFIGLISWISLVTNGEKSDTSIIEQNSKEESQFKVVIVE
ncbi:hypothetical protein [Vibrio crassostreae]|uniref:hypothetical protein n=1 Tax=Vibrio crassostreae TaxID=246167 RepID=UPI001B30D076|nr:hypothetical protein [Vibrio crassostreae]